MFFLGTPLYVCKHITILINPFQVRKELIDLQQSRLYHHVKERHKPPHTKHSDDQSQTVTLPTGEEPEGPITQGTEASGTEGPNTPGTQASGTESGSTPSSKKPIIHEDLWCVCDLLLGNLLIVVKFDVSRHSKFNHFVSVYIFFISNFLFFFWMAYIWSDLVK